MTKNEVIHKATTYLRGLSKRRPNGMFSADDLQHFMTTKKYRGNTNERLSVIRTVLQENNGFERVGTVSSTREQARGRKISAWSVSD